jgi:hypothetical protein
VRCAWLALPTLLVLLWGCTPGASIIGPVEVTVSKLEVAVGESVTLTARFRDIPTDARMSETYLAAIPHAYVFSTRDPSTAPYHPDESGNLLPSGDPRQFPVDAALEVQTPVTGSNNVPPLNPASRENGVLSSTFVLKGRSVGKAHVHVGFLLESKRAPQPSGWTRVPLMPSGLGSVTITVRSEE